MSNIKRLTSYFLLLTSFTLTSCVDNPIPTSTLLPEQVQSMDAAQKAMLSGIVAFVNDFQTWSSSDVYYTQDWGYPCQMFYREVLGADIPVYGGNYNYWINIEKNESLMGAANYTYYYYYKFINNCNNLIGLIDPATVSEESRQYLGCALTFRALCYLDIARMFEFQPTGIAALDNEASTVTLSQQADPQQVPGIWGLTVPIVTDKTPKEQLNKNPRVRFSTMYRFILNDLNQAEKQLANYKRSTKNYPDLSVVYGMQARLWLEMASRFDNTEGNARKKQQAAEDWAEQLALEGTNDGYADLGVTTVKDCYAKAADYARKAQADYTPMTEAEWKNPVTGFNTETEAWMLLGRISTQEQEPNYYSSLLGTVCTEATWAMPQYGGGNYRCIGTALYDKMPDSDWRKTSWIDPEDASTAKEAAKDEKANKETFQDLRTKYRYSVSDSLFSTFPAYANLKFRARDNKDMVEGMKCDIPLMRVEEMYLIEAEAESHATSLAEGIRLLQRFVNTYRYTDGSYTCDATTQSAFNKQLAEQKRIEFWGEGICYFDYKRLRLQVLRTESTNYPSDMQHDSKAGYVCPAMSYYILNYEMNNNPYVKRNPDCSKWYKK